MPNERRLWPRCGRLRFTDRQMRNLQTAIDEETDKLIRRFESYARQLAD
jgi:hypothetical protein